MNDEDPAYARKLQSNSGRARAFDGGAVAAGLCFGVFAILVSIAGPLTTEIRLVFTTLCLFCGGVTAGYLTRRGASGALQGAVVTLLTAGLMAAVSVSISVGAGSLFRVPLVLAYETLSTVGFAALLGLSVCFGALAGALGTRLRR
ncbi:MAG: hypothetical protein IH933_05775 [Euryarchaeota archaeon]|nr:hypothetical protein [Euryarchaeota archaeon]